MSTTILFCCNFGLILNTGDYSGIFLLLIVHANPGINYFQSCVCIGCTGKGDYGVSPDVVSKKIVTINPVRQLKNMFLYDSGNI